MGSLREKKLPPGLAPPRAERAAAVEEEEPPPRPLRLPPSYWQHYGIRVGEGAPDPRPLPEKEADLDAALRTVDEALQDPAASRESVEAELPRVKAHFGMEELRLIEERRGRQRAFGRINPQRGSDGRWVLDDEDRNLLRAWYREARDIPQGANQRAVQLQLLQGGRRLLANHFRGVDLPLVQTVLGAVDAAILQLTPAQPMPVVQQPPPLLLQPVRSAEDIRLDGLVGMQGRDREVLRALVRAAPLALDPAILAAYDAHQHVKVADVALALALAGHLKLGPTPLAQLLDSAKVASGLQLRQLLDHAKVVSAAVLAGALAHLKVVSGAELLTLLGNDARIDTLAHLMTLLDAPASPNTTALATFFANPHSPTVVEVLRVVATIADWNAHWAARLNVTDGDAGDRNYQALRGRTLRQLSDHADAQADWHRGLASEDERAPVRSLLAFLRNTPGALEGCGGWRLSDVVDGVGTDATRWSRLRAYAKGARGSDSAPIRVKDTVDLGLAAGRDLLLLEAALGAPLLQETFADGSFEALSPRLTDFLNYWNTCHPNFSARQGAEVRAYLALRADVDPATYRATLAGWMVNFHRFRRSQLNRLALNVADRSKRLPVTVLIHSPLGKDDAFHRDASLTEVIERDDHLTLLIEGQANLDAISGILNNVTANYCPAGRIANVMLIGHGQARAIELAGTTDDRGREHDTGLDIGHGADRTFLRSLIDSMVDHVNTRLILAACHTNSHELERTGGLTGNEVQDLVRLNNYIRDNPSLAKFSRDYAESRGNRMSVVGANGATREGIGFLAGNGNLTLRDDAGDPAVAGTKLEYVRQGTDPKGVMRAVLEEWTRLAADRTALFAAMTTRAQANSADWREQTTRLLFRIILDHYRARADQIQRMIEAAAALKKLRYDEDATPAKLADAGLSDDEFGVIDAGVRGTTAWTTDNPFLPVLFHQRAGRTDNLIAALGALDRRVATLVKQRPTYIAANYDFATALPLAGAAAAGRGRVLLAIIGFKRHDSAHCRDYLRAYLNALGGNELPWEAVWAVSKQSLSRDVGLLAAPAPAPRAANLRVGGDRNTGYVEPLTRVGRTRADARVHAAPDAAAASEPIDANRNLNVIGRLPDWFAVENGAQTAYIPQNRLDLLPA